MSIDSVQSYKSMAGLAFKFALVGRSSSLQHYAQVFSVDRSISSNHVKIFEEAFYRVGWTAPAFLGR
jgi:hypothetical protein